MTYLEITDGMVKLSFVLMNKKNSGGWRGMVIALRQSGNVVLRVGEDFLNGNFMKTP